MSHVRHTCNYRMLFTYRSHISQLQTLCSQHKWLADWSSLLTFTQLWQKQNKLDTSADILSGRPTRTSGCCWRRVEDKQPRPQPSVSRGWVLLTTYGTRALQSTVAGFLQKPCTHVCCAKGLTADKLRSSYPRHSRLPVSPIPRPPPPPPNGGLLHDIRATAKQGLLGDG